MKPVHQTLLSALALLVLLAPGAAAQSSSLGSIEFPTSGPPEAQKHFLRGVAALHSFWFEEALEAFRASTQARPDFWMGYWGEAMAHNHPLWAEQNTDAARKVLEKIGDTGSLTPRERAYIEAVRALYGPGDKLARDQAYAAAMEKVYRDYPSDLEAATFYALSLLGTVRPGDKGFARQARAGAVVLDVFQKNPNHPGAAHFIIHAFDDPEHAILALPAAYRYAQIAPEAHHARHMPAHIFLQLGMWPEAAASNQSAWDASVAWVARKKLSGALRDFHSLHWLIYVNLQQGRYANAEGLYVLRKNAAAESGGASGGYRTSQAARYLADASAEIIVDTERWVRAAELFPETTAASGGDAGAHQHGVAPANDASSAAGAPPRDQVLAAFVRGLAAPKLGQPQAEKEQAALGAWAAQADKSGRGYYAREIEIMQLEVLAQGRASSGEFAKAMEAMRRATKWEEEMSPPSGPPGLIKPSHELFGEILLAAGKPKEAAEQFASALARQPNRARALLGAARAAAQSGDRAAAHVAYENFARVWSQADKELAELKEAREFLKSAPARAGR